MIKYAILGTNGFLSNAIGNYCEKHGIEVDMYGRREPTLFRYNNFYQIDLMKEDLICNNLLNCDMIIYAIGAGVQSNLKESVDCIYRLNVMSPVNICNKLKELKYQGILVTFGSYFEMGETQLRNNFTEEDILNSHSNAPNDYVVSKRMLSRFVASYKHSFTHWHFIIPTIYGEGENPRRLIPYVINGIKNKEDLYLTSGKQVRQYLYVEEIPHILELAYYKCIPSGIYNISGNETLSVREIVEMIYKTFGKQISNVKFGAEERMDEVMSYLALNGQKLFGIIGYTPHRFIKDVLINY